MEQKRILVTGASGFIGHHLCNYLKDKGNWVRGVDWRDPEYDFKRDEFLKLDLRDPQNCMKATEGIDEVYALAADMGGMGFIQDKKNQGLILHNNALINLNTLEAARQNKVKKYLYSSSACVYPNYKQQETNIAPLKEEDAYPADPQDTYGWEKLMAEILCKAYEDSYGMNVRMFRFHNVYGPEGTWKDGREKAPAALSRKVIMALKKGEDNIEVWGDGEQTRSFCHISDCLKGMDLIMHGDYTGPVNLGRDEMISINDFARLIMKISGADLKIKHIEGPQGVRGRNSDNSLFKKLYGWAPEVTLEEGMKKTYAWIKEEIERTGYTE